MPKFTTGADELIDSLDRLERDVHRKIFFSGSDERFKRKSKLFVPSDWRPDPQDVPHFIFTRFERFRKAMARLFRRQKVRSNLLPFQESLLNALRQDHGLVVANSDKGLGPIVIELRRYLRDALVHLLDADTY